MTRPIRIIVTFFAISMVLSSLAPIVAAFYVAPISEMDPQTPAAPICRGIDIYSRPASIIGNNHAIGPSTSPIPQPFSNEYGLVFSTYFGGNQSETIESIHVESDGSIIILGTTNSLDLPTTPGVVYEDYPVIHALGGYYLAKINSNASEIIWCTYLDGAGSYRDMAVDTNGSVHLAGDCGAINLPVTPNAFCSTVTGGLDWVYTVVDPTGSKYLYCTYLGGSEYDRLYQMELNADGNGVFVGTSKSDDFPMTGGAYCSTHGGQEDIVAAVMDSSSGTLISSTFLGGPAREGIGSLSLDPDGNLVFYGGSDLTTFKATPGAYDTTPWWSFICSISASLTQLRYLTFLSKFTIGEVRLHVQDNGSVWLMGRAQAGLPVTSNAFQEVPNDDYAGFIARLDGNGTSLGYCTYFGGYTNYEAISDLVPINRTEIIFTGATYNTSLPFPTSSHDHTHNGESDQFVVWLDLEKGTIINGTYIGGTFHEYTSHLALGDDGLIIIGSTTRSTDYPTIPGFLNDTLKGSYDATLAGIVFGRTPHDVPTSPLNVTVTEDDGEVVITWKEPHYDGSWPILNYTVYWGTTPTPPWIYHQVVEQRRLTVSGLNNGVTYYFLITASNEYGEGAGSGPVSAIPYGPMGRPQNLKATPSCSTILLEWNEPYEFGGLPVVGYYVFRSDKPTNYQMIAELGNVIQYLDEGLDNGQIYYYKVRAFNNKVEGVDSAPVSATPIGPPGIPSIFVAIGGEGEVHLEWRYPHLDGGRAILGFKLYKGLTEDALEMVEELGDVLTYTDYGVTNGVTYYYTLLAFNDVDEGPMANVVNATPLGRPEIPLDLEFEIGDGVLNLFWKPPINDGGTPVQGYHVYRGQSPTNMVLHSDTEEPAFQNVNLVNGREYFYHVSAFNEVGEGTPSATMSATPLGLPGSPRDLTINQDPNGMLLRWLAPTETGGSDIVGYTIYRGLEDPPTLPIDLVGPEINEYMDGGLDKGVPTHYMVTARTIAGESVASAVVSGEFITQPGMVVDLVATAQLGSVALVWNPPDDVGGRPVLSYTLYRGKSPGALSTLAAGITGTTYLDWDVEFGQSYFYSVSPATEFGLGDQIPEVQANPLFMVPGKPLDLVAEVNGKTVSLMWKEPLDNGSSPITRYVLMKGTSPDTMAVLAQIRTSLTYEDNAVDWGTTYYYSIQAVNAVGEGETTASVQVKIEPKDEGEGGPSMSLMLIVIALFVVILVVSIIVIWRQRASDKDMDGSEPNKPPDSRS